ncbi:MAG: hypothetical protein ACRCWQ_13750 [Bacilli bacterium]
MKLIKRDGFDKMPLTKKPDETVSMFKYGEDVREAVRIVAEKKERKEKKL